MHCMSESWSKPCKQALAVTSPSVEPSLQSEIELCSYHISAVRLASTATRLACSCCLILVQMGQM